MFLRIMDMMMIMNCCMISAQIWDFSWLVCPVQRYENTTAADRIKLVEIYESKVRQALSTIRVER